MDKDRYFVLVSLNPNQLSQILFDVEEIFEDLLEWETIHLGYGSKQGFKACAYKGTPLEIVKKMYDFILDQLTDNELTILGIYRNVEDDKRVLRCLGGCLVVVGDLEHCSCCIYQMLAWAMPNRRTCSAQPAQPHNHPSKIERMTSDKNNSALSTRVLTLFKKMVKEGNWKGVSEQFRLPNEDAVSVALDGFEAAVSIASLPSDDTLIGDSAGSDNTDSESDIEPPRKRAKHAVAV